MQLKLTYLVNLDLVKSHHQNLHTLLNSTAMVSVSVLKVEKYSLLKAWHAECNSFSFLSIAETREIT